MKKWNFIFLFILLSFLAGCGKAPTEVVTEPTSTPQTLSPGISEVETIATGLPEPTATEAPPLHVFPDPPENRTRYKIDLIFNYYSHFGSVTQQITYTNKSSQPMPEIMLVVPPRNYQDSYSQYSLGGDLYDWYREEGIFTYIRLTRPLEPLETTVINLSFRIYLPQYPGIYGYTNQQANLADWYPFIPPYDETEGWLAYERVIDGYNTIVGEWIVNEFSDFEVSLTLVSHADIIEVAASAPAQGADGKYTYKLDHARAFTFSISDSYFEHEVVQDGVTIRSYVFMNQIETGIDVTEIAAKALKLYGEKLYPYPRDMVSIVVGDFQQNMEMDGLVMISFGILDFHDGKPESDLDYNLFMLVPHELAHQWFYGLIGNNHALDPWLDEALATYAELLYYEHYHPESVDWWWRMRVYKFAPSGYVDSNIWIHGGYEPYISAVYLQGALYLHEIRHTIGDGAFFAAIKDYAYENTFNLVTKEDFFAAFSRHTDVDLSPITAKYFQNP